MQHTAENRTTHITKPSTLKLYVSHPQSGRSLTYTRASKPCRDCLSPDLHVSAPPAVRHATAAYQALSQGVASKRRTKSFDMAALPSVPEMNDSNIPSRTSQEVGPLCMAHHSVSSAFPVHLGAIVMSCHA